MNKYEKFVLENSENKEHVKKVLAILDGVTFENAKMILDSAAYFVGGNSTFYNGNATSSIDSLGDGNED